LGLPPVHPAPPSLSLAATPSSSSSGGGGGGGGGGGAGAGTPMLLARLQARSPAHANRANALLNGGCSKAVVKEIMACEEHELREARLAEEEARAGLEPLAPPMPS
jgi:hypothetical protein